jgi:hypothetical protein
VDVDVDADVNVRDGFLRGDRGSAGDEEDGSEAEAEGVAPAGLRFALRSF